MAFWKSMGDNLKNGTILGMVVALAMMWGNNVYSWLLINVPPSWTSVIPLWASLLAIGGIIGYIFDKY